MSINISNVHDLPKFPKEETQFSYPNKIEAAVIHIAADKLNQAAEVPQIYHRKWACMPKAQVIGILGMTICCVIVAGCIAALVSAMLAPNRPTHHSKYDIVYPNECNDMIAYKNKIVVNSTSSLEISANRLGAEYNLTVPITTLAAVLGASVEQSFSSVINCFDCSWVVPNSFIYCMDIYEYFLCSFRGVISPMEKNIPVVSQLEQTLSAIASGANVTLDSSKLKNFTLDLVKSMCEFAKTLPHNCQLGSLCERLNDSISLTQC